MRVVCYHSGKNEELQACTNYHLWYQDCRVYGLSPLNGHEKISANSQLLGMAHIEGEPGYCGLKVRFPPLAAMLLFWNAPSRNRERLLS